MQQLTLLLLFLFTSFGVVGQDDSLPKNRVVKRQVVSAQTGLPLSYVTIIVSGSSRMLTSDVAGFFTLTLDEKIDSIAFKRISLKEKILSKGAVEASSIIELDEINYHLEDVVIVPTYRDALDVMVLVRNRFMVSNPDLNTDYSCYIYNKMVFDIDSNRVKIRTKRVDKEKLVDYARINHLLLIESVTERIHIKGGRSLERVITGRTSGFRQPALEFVPSQIQPFAFYKSYISLFNTDYLNPISPLGLKMYEFQLRDTLVSENGDTLYHITFAPKHKLTFKSLTGYFQVKSGSYDIAKVNAKGYSDDTNNGVSLTQSYQKEGVTGYFFPSYLEAKVELGNVTYADGKELPLVGTLKSYLTNLNVSPIVNKDNLAREKFYQPNYYTESDSIVLNQFRPIPLSSKETTSYIELDSVGRSHQLDTYIEFGRSLAEGYVPAGYLKIDYTKIIDYNRKEGLSLGMGLATSEDISDRFKVGGYYRYGFSDHASKWGVLGNFYWIKEREFKVEVGYKEDLIPTGSYSFLDGYPLGSSESFKRFSLTGMDFYKQMVSRVEGRFLNDVKGALYVNWNKSTHTSTSYDGDLALMNSDYKQICFMSTGVNLRWADGEEFVKTSLRRIAVPGFMHYVWLNYSYINGRLEESAFSGHKVEAQLEKKARIGASMVATVRLIGGNIFGRFPFSLNYNAFGTYFPFSLDVPYTLATMRPQEFMADRFCMSFVRYKIPIFMQSSHNFKPVLYLNGAAAWGEMSRYPNTSFENGYYEGGVVLDNLLKLVFFKYGVGLYYRMGRYQLPNSQDNWAFKVSIEFAL